MFWLFIACLLALVAADQDDKQLDVASSCPVGFKDSPGCSSTDLMADRGFQTFNDASAKHIHWVEASGKKTPEYTVLLQSLVDISENIEAEKEDFSRSILSARIIPILKPSHDLMTLVLAEVAVDALKFYAFLQVLDQRNLNDRYTSLLEQLSRNFLDEMRRYVPLKASGQADDCDIFISYSQTRAFGRDSPNSFNDAQRLYNYLLESEGLRPWIDENKRTLGDSLSSEILSALKRCRAIIPIVTRGYVRSIQCVRELYYFTLLHPQQCHCYPMMSEMDQIEREHAGKWLMKQIITVKCLQQSDKGQMISQSLLQKMKQGVLPDISRPSQNNRGLPKSGSTSSEYTTIAPLDAPSVLVICILLVITGVAVTICIKVKVKQPLIVTSNIDNLKGSNTGSLEGSYKDTNCETEDVEDKMNKEQVRSPQERKSPDYSEGNKEQPHLAQKSDCHNEDILGRVTEKKDKTQPLQKPRDVFEPTDLDVNALSNDVESFDDLVQVNVRPIQEEVEQEELDVFEPTELDVNAPSDDVESFNDLVQVNVRPIQGEVEQEELEQGDVKKETGQTTATSSHEAVTYQRSRLSTSSDISPTPSTMFTDPQLQVSGFIGRFNELRLRTKAEFSSQDRVLEKNNFQDLMRTLPQECEEYYHRYVPDQHGCSWPPKSFEDLHGNDLNDFCQSCFDYRLLKFVVRNGNCSRALKRDVEQFSADVNEFKRNVTVLELLQMDTEFPKTAESFPSGCSKLRITYDINPGIMTIDFIDRFREQVWAYPNLSKCSLHVYSMSKTSVNFAVPKRFYYAILKFVCSKEGEDLMQLGVHQIGMIDIDDIQVNHELLLLESAIRGDWETVESLLDDQDMDIDLNYRKGTGSQTALFHLAARGVTDLVQKMLALGASLNIRDINGYTPLMVAVEAGQRKVVEIMLKNPKYKPEATEALQKNANGQNVLHIATEKGFTDIFELLSKCYSEVGTPPTNKEKMTDSVEQEEKGKNGEEEKPKGWYQRWQINRQLTNAAKNGSVSEARKALDSGADANRIINRALKRTPLLEACQRGHTDVVKLLLSRGANPNHRAAEDWNALVLASRYGHVETVELLLLWNPSCREIINVKAGYYGWTPLHTTCYYNSYELTFKKKEEFLKRLERVTQLLLDNGADATIKDNDGENTPLTYACDKGYVALADLLVKKTQPQRKQKELIDYKRKDGMCALLLAAKHGYTEIVRILLDAGASTKVANKNKMTALHLGVDGNHVDTVRLLASRVDHSAIDAKDKRGFSPSMMATKQKRVELVKVLHQNGADFKSEQLVLLLKQLRTDLEASDSLSEEDKVFIEYLNLLISLRPVSSSSRRVDVQWD